MKKIVWSKRKPRLSIAENIAARIEANRARTQAECDELRARLAVLSPDREKQN
jgi:hypothetical protein